MCCLVQWFSGSVLVDGEVHCLSLIGGTVLWPLARLLSTGLT